MQQYVCAFCLLPIRHYESVSAEFAQPAFFCPYRRLHIFFFFFFFFAYWLHIYIYKVLSSEQQRIRPDKFEQYLKVKFPIVEHTQSPPSFTNREEGNFFLQVGEFFGVSEFRSKGEDNELIGRGRVAVSWSTRDLSRVQSNVSQSSDVRNKVFFCIH